MSNPLTRECIRKGVVRMNDILARLRDQSARSIFTAVYCVGNLNQTQLVLQIGYAKALGKPVVLIITAGIHLHPFIEAIVDHVVLDDGDMANRERQLEAVAYKVLGRKSPL